MKQSRVVNTLKVAQAGEVDIATKGSFETGCDQPFVKPWNTIMLVNVLTRRQNIPQNTVFFVGFLQFKWRDHQGHFDNLKGLQDSGGDDPAHQSVNSFLINHFNLMQFMNLINNFNSNFIQRLISANIIQMPKKNFDFIQLFLQNSPISHHKKFMKIITVPQSHKVLPPRFLSNREYVDKYLKTLEFMPTVNHQINFTQQDFRKIAVKPKLLYRSSSRPESQSVQLFESIKHFCSSMNQSFIPYQQLQQLLTIAQPETIKELRLKLTYLFKILLNKRGKLDPSSHQMEVNLLISQAIIKAFQRSAKCRLSSSQKSKLQATQKLLKARDNQKKGLHEVAMASFQQIFKDQAVESQTRMQALKIICSEGEQQGDISILQLLMSQTQEKGERQFEQYIKQSIKKIKQGLNSKLSD